MTGVHHVQAMRRRAAGHTLRMRRTGYRHCKFSLAKRRQLGHIRHRCGHARHALASHGAWSEDRSGLCGCQGTAGGAGCGAPAASPGSPDARRRRDGAQGVRRQPDRPGRGSSPSSPAGPGGGHRPAGSRWTCRRPWRVYNFPAPRLCGCSSVGRARRCQRRCRGFESHHPLFCFWQRKRHDTFPQHNSEPDDRQGAPLRSRRHRHQ